MTTPRNVVVTVDNDSGDIHVNCPYTPPFVDMARSCQARYSRTAQRWTFDRRDRDTLKAALLDLYGYDMDTGTFDRVDVRVSIPDGMEANRAPIVICAIPVATATDRDSDARLDDGVRIIDGGFTSGGSKQYWTTTTGRGPVIFDLFDVARAQAIDGEKYTVAIIPRTDQAPSRETLVAERDALLRRVMELDNLIDNVLAD